MRPLAPIYSHRVPEFMETQVEFNPNQKRNSNPKRKLQPRPSVDRPVDRPRPRSTSPVERANPRARPLQSVDRARSTAPSCARPCTPVDRPPPPVDREVDREHNWPAPCAVSRSFVVRSLCYLLPSLLSPLSHNLCVVSVREAFNKLLTRTIFTYVH